MERESLIYIAFLYLRHHKGDLGGYEKKKNIFRGAWRVALVAKKFQKCWHTIILDGFEVRHEKKSVGVQRFWRGLYQRNATAGIAY